MNINLDNIIAEKVLEDENIMKRIESKIEMAFENISIDRITKAIEDQIVQHIETNDTISEHLYECGILEEYAVKIIKEKLNTE